MSNILQPLNETGELSKENVQEAFDMESIQASAKIKILTTASAGQAIAVDLPVSNNKSDDQQEVLPLKIQKAVYNFNGKTLLAVDDVAFNLTLVELYFKNTGAHLLFAADGREALDICISNPQVDAVLMDIQMPVMNGLEATREIHKIKPGMPVIAITAYVHSDDRQRCFDAGCIEFLPKPCSRDDMLRTVNKFM